MALRWQTMIKTMWKLVEIYSRPKRGQLDWLCTLHLLAGQFIVLALLYSFSWCHTKLFECFYLQIFKRTWGVDISYLWTRRASSSLLPQSRCQRMHLCTFWNDWWHYIVVLLCYQLVIWFLIVCTGSPDAYYCSAFRQGKRVCCCCNLRYLQLVT